MATPLLTRRALVLAKIESTYNTDASPDQTNDAILVEDPDYSVDVTMLNRNFVKTSLSKLGVKSGRKLASLGFSMEFRSNGKTNSGSLSDAPIAGRMLRACGFSETAVSGTGTVGAVKDDSGNTNDPSAWAVGGESTYQIKADYTITCVKAGASATAELRVTGGTDDNTSVLPSEARSATVEGVGTLTLDESDPTSVTYTVGGTFTAGDKFTAVVNGETFTHTVVAGDTDNDGIATALAALIDANTLLTASATAAVVTVTIPSTAVTSGSTALDLGGSGTTVTPTFSGSLTLGDKWTVTVSPKGIKYLPVSTGFESMTLYAYFDGLLHKITGALGTFSINAQAGDYAKINFTFTGQYVAPIDAAMPNNAVHETALPPMMELAKLKIDDFSAVVDTFSYDQANQIVPRTDVNYSDGFNGVRLTARDPSGGIDPEATLVADHDFWDKLATSVEMPFSMRVGTEAGNTILITSPKTQYTGLTYQARDEIRVLDAGLSFAQDQGDDEVEFFFA